MNKNYYGSIILLSISLLSSCQSSLPYIIPSQTIIPVTDKPLPTATITTVPTKAITPTESEVPTETPIPVPEYYHGIAPSLDEFTMVKVEDEPLIMADIMAHPELTPQPLDTFSHIQKLVNGAYSEVAIQCAHEIRCVVRASIKEKNPYGGDDIWKVIWELCPTDGLVKEYFGRYLVCNPGEAHKYIIGYIGGPGDPYIEHDANTGLQIILRSSAYHHICIVTKIQAVSSVKWNPIALDLTNNAPEQAQNAFSDLNKTLNISDDFSHMTVFLFYLC
jgi:hypothetical protein